MRRSLLIVHMVLFAIGGVGIASAQTEAPLSQVEMAIACAPPTAVGAATAQLHILGAQDTMDRVLYGTHDMLVVDGGTASNVQIGERFYVRRANRFGGIPDGTAVTAAWVSIVAVNESTAIANIDHLCGPVLRDDYLEAFVAPVEQVSAERDRSQGDPDFSSLGHIIIGNEQRSIVGAGDFALIDRGTEHGVATGERFAVYRDIGIQGMPLSSVGEAVVVSAGETTSLARITRSRDAIFVGDYVAPRK